ncbi:hypothetical protein DI392_12245 [Vibrio albus]|uniref:SF3 helicase domain-containing protein n=1 Tax=Vibrio albus TaxID=2200953 RepID=A0A2U3B8G3_9VIBR|nr:DUF5906 domain-containing protein [Vibrio albus]PWI33072.1 hypothetical protein DI392_12245 [Vibrio albus]
MTIVTEVSIAATGNWQSILDDLGIPVPRNGKHGPCPICKDGKTRFRFDNKNGRGTWLCGDCIDKGEKQAKAGDGLSLVAGAMNCSVLEAAKLVAPMVGITNTPLDKEAFIQKKKQIAEQKQKDERSQNLRRKKAVERASYIWKSSKEAPKDHFYLVAKGIHPHGARILSKAISNGSNRPAFEQGTLIVPIKSVQGIISLELISHNRKEGLSGGQKAGGFFVLDEPLGSELSKAPRIWISEGFATAATVKELTGDQSVCAFSAGQLPGVAETIRKLYPNVEIFIAADADETGIAKAEQAANICDGYVAIPKFTDGDTETGTDWNDLASQEGVNFAKQQLMAAIKLNTEHKKTIPNPTNLPNQKDNNIVNTGSYIGLGIKSNGLGQSKMVRPDLGKDSKVAFFLASNLHGQLAVDDDEGELYKWDNKAGFWKSNGVATKRLERVTYDLLKKHYGEDGFASSKIGGVAKALTYELESMPMPDSSKIVFKNGVLNPLTGKFTACNVRQLYARYSTGVDYYPSNGTLDECPNFRDYLLFVSGLNDSNVDDERAQRRFNIILAAMLMVLLRRYDWQKFIEVVGPGGTGKSTLAGLIGLLVGESSVSSIESKDLETPERRADIVNSALLYLADMEHYQGEGSGLKKITGGDPVSCRRLYGQSFNAYIRAVILAVNNDPMRFSDKGGAIARRRVIIHLYRKVSEQQKKQGLKEALRQEVPAIIQYLLSWMADNGGEHAMRKILHDATNGDDAREVLAETDPMIKFASGLYYHPEAKAQVGGMPSASYPLRHDQLLFHAYLRFCSYEGIDRHKSPGRFSSEFKAAAERYGEIRIAKPKNKATFYGVSVTGGDHKKPEWMIDW